MKVPILRKDNKYYIQIPEELKNSTPLELFQLKDGYYLLVSNLGSTPIQEPKDQEKEPSKELPKEQGNQKPQVEKEFSVISKLLSLKFSERTPFNVSKLLSQEEKEIFNNLLKSKKVTLFKKGKYEEEGVYNIDDELFHHWKEFSSKQQPIRQQSVPSGESELFESLRRNGFIILLDQNSARRFSDYAKSQSYSMNIRGIKSFDEKFYFVTGYFFNKIRNLILSKVKDAMALDEIANLCDTSKDGCNVVLILMAEDGEVIEKRRDVFELI